MDLADSFGQARPGLARALCSLSHKKEVVPTTLPVPLNYIIGSVAVVEATDLPNWRVVLGRRKSASNT